MTVAIDDEWYFDNVLPYTQPGRVDLIDGPIREWEMWWLARWRELGETDVGRIARDQGFVATVGQVSQAGLSRGRMRGEVRRGRLWVPGYGTLSPVVPDGDDWPALRRRHALAACAAGLRLGDQVISARSAAIAWGLPTFRIPDRPELTAAPPETIGRRGPLHLYSAALRSSDVTQWYGIHTTTPPRTVLDLARHDRWDAIMAADAALREHLVTRAELRQHARAATGWPGIRQARELLLLASPLAESPLESLTRLRLHDDDFPVPELQVWIPDPHLGRRYRVDLLLRKQRLIIEADGKGKYTDEELWREKRRERRIKMLTGFDVERVIPRDVTTDWPETMARLRHAARLPP